jgi:hypothetical protein
MVFSLSKLDAKLVKNAEAAATILNNAVGTAVVTFDNTSSNLIYVDTALTSSGRADGIDMSCTIRVNGKVRDLQLTNLKNAVFAHEITHCLGVWGHSDNPKDLMYKYVGFGNMLPTEHDINSIKEALHINQPGGASSD